jgi:hypothetical protein
MADELEEMCHRMKLSDHEKHHIRLRKDRVAKSHQEAKFSTMFKLQTSRQFNGEAFKNSVQAMWTVHGDLTISEFDDNLFLAAFSTEAALNRIFALSPWTFDKKLILLARLKGDLQPSAVKFTHTIFWIRVVNLPIKCMTHEVGEDIGMQVRKILDVDVPNENGIAWGRFLRIWLEVELAKPLMRGCIIQVEDDKPVWVDFRYEHLPIFCYKCGFLGHSSSDCTASRGSARVSVFDRDQYGSWLRALPARHHQPARRKSEVGDGLGNQSNSNSHGENGSDGGGGGEPETLREDRIEVTSADNQALQSKSEHVRALDLAESVDTEKEVLHVPGFMDTQLGTVSFNDEQFMGLKIGNDTPTLPTPYDLEEKMLKDDREDNIQGMDTGQRDVQEMNIFARDGQGVQEFARVSELENIKQVGAKVDGLDRSESTGPVISKAQIKKSTWKKRARAALTTEDMGPTTNLVIWKGKRAVREEEENGSVEDEENNLKKARISGEVIIHDSESVAAVEQRRRT